MMGVMSRRRPRPTPQPVELTPGDKFWGATFDPRSGFQAGTKPMSETAKQAQALTSFLNPLATVTEKALAGETPKFSDYATDAGFLAAGLIPFVGPGLRAGGQAARSGAKPVFESAEAAAKERSIQKLLDWQGPEAIYDFRWNPETAYKLNPELLRRFFAETSERIPAGSTLYRAPSRGEVLERLPREVGAEFLPGVVKSAAGSSDLQRLGGLLAGRGGTTGKQVEAPGMSVINVMEDLPGINNINDFLPRYNPNWRLSEFNQESVLGPATKYILDKFIPAVNNLPPTWYFNAYPR